MKIRASLLVKAVGVYSTLVVSLISFAILTSAAPAHEKAIIKMALGLILLWIIVGGTLMYRFRDRFKPFILRIPLPWQLKFFLFCVLLALLEEAVTVTMTNLAPLFGAEIGKAYITASANYLHTVLFHSVIMFIPMFLVWTLILHRYAFPPGHVFLLFGLIGSLAEMSMNAANVFGGFWFFVYGLMIYLPAYTIPPDRPARRPRWWIYLASVPATLLSPILLLPAVPLLRYLWRIMQPTFFVPSAWD